MGFLGTQAGNFSDALIVGEVVITALVIAGVRYIRHDRIRLHRTFMLSALGLNLAFLVVFLVQDIAKLDSVFSRGSTTPLLVFVPLLVVHLSIAITGLTVAIRSWLIARQGVVRDGKGKVIAVTPDVRVRHRRISRYYPWLWYSTLATGLLLYGALYVFE